MNGFTEDPQTIAATTAYAELSVGQQFSCVAVEITGTITTGNLQIKGLITGANTPTLFTENVEGGNNIAQNLITAAGIYRVASAALKVVRVVPSDDFTGSVSVTMCATESLPPVAVVGFG